MIRILKSGERNRIREFYQDIFDDSEAFVEYYFGTYIKSSTKCFVDEEQGIPVSMASIHEKKWNMKEGGLETVWYVYAVATRPKYRRQGRMTQILNAIRQNAMQEKVRFLYLIPVNPDIYKPFGFVEVRKSETVRWEYEAEKRMATEKPMIAGKPMTIEKPVVERCHLTSVTEMQKQQEDIFVLLADMHRTCCELHDADAYLEKTADYYREEYQRIRIENGDIYILWNGTVMKAFIAGILKDRVAHIVEYVDMEGMSYTSVKGSYWSVMLELLHEQAGITCMEYTQNPVMIYSVDGTSVPRLAGQMDEV